MSPQQQQQQQIHGKRDNQITNNGNNKPILCPQPLKINKDSHLIRKTSSSSNTSSPSSSSSSTTSLVNGVAAAAAKPPPQRHPVIIYTHSPKIIHTHPRDFMALVQKLTGMSRSDHDHEASTTKLATTKSVVDENNNNNNKGSKAAVVNDDNESSSVVTTDENCCGGGGSGLMEVGQVNSCFGPAIFEPPPPPPPQLANSYLTNIPIYTPNSTEFLCTNQPIFNYDDSLLFGGNRSVNDFCEYSEF